MNPNGDPRRAVSALCRAGTALPAWSFPKLSSLLAANRSHAVWEPGAMKISARNQFKGKILDVKKGATTGHVRIEIATGIAVTSSITNEAIDELGLKPGMIATAVIKASDVMVAVD
jgi:molybdopterin-binding protein